jgi:hypothetical protein
MPLQIIKAIKEQVLLRGSFFGPSGSGKTYTALRVAKGMGGSWCFIDSERKSARKYADEFDFHVIELETNQRTIDHYLEAMQLAAKGGFNLIIDSLSHPWEELKDEVEKIAKAKFKGNTWAAWSEGTPMQKKMVNALLDFPHHLICTMRSRTEWASEKDERGRTSPKRIGLSPEQRPGLEYEFDFLLELNTEHIGIVIKDRTRKFQDKIIEKPGEAFGKELLEWLNTGEKPASSGEPTQFSNEYDSFEVVLESSKDLDQLKKAWIEINSSELGEIQKKSLLNLKDKMKVKLSFPKETPPKETTVEEKKNPVEEAVVMPGLIYKEFSDKIERSKTLAELDEIHEFIVKERQLKKEERSSLSHLIENKENQLRNKK